jgi:hypothetical protein
VTSTAARAGTVVARRVDLEVVVCMRWMAEFWRVSAPRG